MTDEREIFSYSYAFEKSKEYFGGEELPAKVFLDKYALRDNDCNILEDTPDKMHRRIAKEFARIEKNKFKKPLLEDEIYNCLKDFKYIIPGGSGLSGIGNKYKYISLSNCFVGKSPLDSYSSICKTDEEIVSISKRRGGIGFDISNLRPIGSPTSNASHTSTGIVPFCERYSNTIREVGQAGRRGALILTISVHHPEVVNFIKMKQDLNKINGANVSIRLTDEFLKAVENNEDYEQRWPVDSKKPKISNMVKAKEVWDQIINSSWKCVDYDTEIDVFKNEKLKRYRIGDFHSEYSENSGKEGHKYEIMSLNLKTLETEKKEIINSQEYFNDKKTYNIQIGSGDLIVTEDHIFYKLEKDNGLVPTQIKDIKIGDKIAFSKKSEFGTNQHINLMHMIEMFTDNGYCVCGKEITGILDDNNVKEALGKYDNGWYKTTYYKDKDHLPIREYLKIKDIVDLTIDNLYLKLSRKNKKVQFKLKVDKYFCAFLGIWLAEGSYNSGGNVRFHIHKDELESYKEVFDFVSNIFDCNYSNTIQGNYCCVNFNSSFIKKIIVGTALKKYLCDKMVPDFINSSIKENVAAFLKGVFSGDGTVSKKGVISFSQSNLIIIKDIQKLLLKFGIHCSISKKNNKGHKEINGKTCNIKESYKLTIYSKFNDVFKKEIGFFQKNKSNRINEEGDSINFGVPLDLSYDFIYNEMGSYKREYIKTSSIKNHLRLEEDENVSRFLKGSFYYLKLEKKEEIKNIETVYDITVKDNHTFILSNGIILSNSAEPGILLWDNIIRESPADCYPDFQSTSTNPCSELPLSERDSCRLLLLNSYSFVENPFAKNAKFNFDKFYKYAQIAQRLMDDIIDLEIENIDNIIKKIKQDPEPLEIKRDELSLWEDVRKSCHDGRRTGTGLNAIGDTIAACGFKYGSKKSINFVDEIFKTLKIGCYRSSVDMAKEIGPFNVWNHDLEKNNPFLLRIKEDDLELWKDMKRFGRRNIGMLTMAPSGSISILTGTTSGIEPLFQTSYMRRKKINVNDDNIKVDFVDNSGDRWQNFEVVHPKIKEWEKITKEKDITKSPWHGCCAEEIDWNKRVLLQATANKNIDHSISSTLNLPEEATIEDVSNIYMSAWKYGCKGITVYRKNCRTGVLIDKKQENKNISITKTAAPRRPKDLPGDLHHVSVKGNKYFVLVGILNGQEPYEVFAGNKDISNLPKQVVIRKQKRNTYSIVDINNNNNILFDDISKNINDEEEALTRMISLGLRHGADINFITHQLEKTNGDMLGFSKAVSRVLKKYIKDGSMVHGESCPECNGELRRQEGCISCQSCGFSKCG